MDTVGKVTVVPIIDLKTPEGARHLFIVLEDGTEIQLPRSQVDFRPGAAVVPTWLWKKVKPQPDVPF